MICYLHGLSIPPIFICSCLVWCVSHHIFHFYDPTQLSRLSCKAILPWNLPSLLLSEITLIFSLSLLNFYSILCVCVCICYSVHSVHKFYGSSYNVSFYFISFLFFFFFNNTVSSSHKWNAAVGILLIPFSKYQIQCELQDFLSHMVTLLENNLSVPTRKENEATN